jgi:hypothetical protein
MSDQPSAFSGQTEHRGIVVLVDRPRTASCPPSRHSYVPAHH